MFLLILNKLGGIMIKKIKSKAIRIATVMSTFLMTVFMKTTAFATDFGDSKLATGTEALINDVTKWLMVISPIATVLFVVYFLIRKSAADEMDAKKWNNRIVVALVCCIGAVLASAIVNLLVGYYQ